MNQSVWTPARTALLVDHYDAGYSAAQSAALIGSVSKNAVISKRRRLGLIGGATVGLDSGFLEGGKALREIFRACRIRRFRGPPPLPTTPLPPMDIAPPADANPRPLAERTFGECGGPLGPAE